jgi:hypothetical protein
MELVLFFLLSALACRSVWCESKRREQAQTLDLLRLQLSTLRQRCERYEAAEAEEWARTDELEQLWLRSQ